MKNRSVCLLVTMVIAFVTTCSAQTFTVVMEPSGTKILKGYCGREDIENDTLFTWFKANYNSYPLDSATIGEMIPLANDVSVVTVIGTWCGDSKREVPHLYKIFDALNISADSLTLYGVDRSKKSDDGVTDKYNILRVPTVIVFRDGLEMGRIVEQPRYSLEKDLLKLMTR